MRTATAALRALITAAYNGTQFEWVYADLYTFTAADGTLLGTYTNADLDLRVNLDGTGGGPVYSSTGPLFTRNSVRTVVGGEVGKLEVTVTAEATDLLAGGPWLQALRNGVLDGGRVTLYRFLSDAWANTAVGAVYWFGGRVGAISEIGRSSAKISVNSDLILLNVQMPRELQEPSCANVLYDSKCALNPVGFKQSGTVVSSGSTTSLINTSGLVQASPYLTLGKIKFTSGPNNGIWRTIRNQPGTNQLTLGVPLFALCGNGDSFDVYAGCDHTLATCVSKFSNKINFRGAPFTPTPEAVT